MNITNDKLHCTLEKFMDEGMVDNFIDVDIKDEVACKLLEYQLIHVHMLTSVLSSSNIAIDGSDTGTGKTYSAIAVCSQMNLRPLIICPKTIMSNWKSVCEHFNVEPLSIVNYETIRLGKEYKDIKDKTRMQNRFVTYDELNKDPYRWTLPKNALLIFDEVHKCKNQSSLNGKLLMSIRNVKHCLLLSATIADKVESFHIYGYLLGFYKSMSQANNWIKGVLKEDLSAKRNIGTIYKKIYPLYGSRMMIEELGDKFPDNQIIATCYDIDNISDVNTQYNRIKNSSNELDNIKKLDVSETNGTNTDEINETKKRMKGEVLKNINESRMKIEYAKLNTIKELAQEYMENNKSVFITVNFKKTLFELGKDLKCTDLLHGDIDQNRRDKIISDFQNNKIKLLIAISTVGGQSISLHDIHGGHPRVSIISPSFSSTDLLQILGRIHRAGSKSKALQRIVFCANTCEEHICKNINEKLKFTQSLNNSDLVGINLDIDFNTKLSKHAHKKRESVKENDKLKKSKKNDTERKTKKTNDITNSILKVSGNNLVVDTERKVVKKKKEKSINLNNSDSSENAIDPFDKFLDKPKKKKKKIIVFT